ncbi:unnamed protein product [Lampetra planeri]
MVSLLALRQSQESQREALEVHVEQLPAATGTSQLLKKEGGCDDPGRWMVCVYEPLCSLRVEGGHLAPYTHHPLTSYLQWQGIYPSSLIVPPAQPEEVQDLLLQCNYQREEREQEPFFLGEGDEVSDEKDAIVNCSPLDCIGLVTAHHLSQYHLQLGGK